MAGGEDALGVDFVVLFEVGDRGIEEFQISVFLSACGVLPAGLFAFGVGELAGGVEALEIDGDGLGHVLVHGEAAGCIERGAAVAVPDEDDGGGSFFGGGRGVDEAAACDAIDGEVELLDAVW